MIHLPTIANVHEVTVRLKAPKPGWQLRLRLSNYNDLEYRSSYCKTVSLSAANKCFSFPDVRQVCMRVKLELIPPEDAGSDSTASLQLEMVHISGMPMWADTLYDSYARCFLFHGPKPLFGICADSDSPFLWQTYARVLERQMACTAGLQILLSGCPGDQGVAIMAPNSPEWIITQLSCLYLRRTVFAVQHTMSIKSLPGVLQQASGVAGIVCSSDVAQQLCADLAAFQNLNFIVCIGDLPDDFGFSDHCIPILPFAQLSDVTDAMPGPTRQIERTKSTEETSTQLMSILFTSGSSGSPKGVPRSFREMLTLHKAYGSNQRPVHLSVEPLSHISEYVTVPAIVMLGGKIGFATSSSLVGNMDLFNDYRRLRPTSVFSVPRLFEALQNMFKDAVAEEKARGMDEETATSAIIAHFRSADGPFGDRVCSMGTGSAPVPPSLSEFMRKVWSQDHGGHAYVSTGYGSTECGTIAADDTVWQTATVYLVERQDFGCSLSSASPQGEILVSTPLVVGNYACDQAQVKPTGITTAEGVKFFRTGDLGETKRNSPELHAENDIMALSDHFGELAGRRAMILRHGAHLAVIGRAKFIVKHPNGEFISPEKIEATLAGKLPGVEQFLVFPVQDGASLVVLAVPKDLASAGNHDAELKVRDAVLKASASGGLHAYETPRAVALLPERWTRENGATTTSNKVQRKAIADMFAADLARVSPGLDGNGTDATTAIKAYLATTDDAAAAALLPDCRDDSQLEEMGGDSILWGQLAATMFQGVASISDIVGLPLPQLRRIALRREEAPVRTSKEIDWGNETQVLWEPKAALKAPSEKKEDGKEGTVALITGVTGFLGPYLLAAIGQSRQFTKIIALLRPPLQRGEVLMPADVELQLVSADFRANGLGLSDVDAAMLASTKIDTIIHSAAHVNMSYSYAQLHAVNVQAADSLVRIAAASSPAFLLVSTISAVVHHAKEDFASTPPDCVQQLGGYGTVSLTCSDCTNVMKIKQLG